MFLVVCHSDITLLHFIFCFFLTLSDVVSAFECENLVVAELLLLFVVTCLQYATWLMNLQCNVGYISSIELWLEMVCFGFQPQ